MDFDFRGLGFQSGEVAVVTGAGNGIGRATAMLLARAGVTVAAWDMDEAGLERVGQEIEAMGGEAHLLAGDLTDQGFVDHGWQTVAQIGGPIRYLVNNAGPASTTPMTVSEGVQVAIGSYAAVAEGFIATAGDDAASMTYTASIAGNFYVGPTPDWYPSAKAGIVGLMRHHAVKYRGNPRVNAVAPAATRTQRTAEPPPGMAEKIARRPLGRIAEPEEVATLICFLLSPAASFVNGVLVPVDGAATWTD
jgi:NAD(P)-dependent dehydrogenase (short-subunit alcohol dehydrogenase family)